jgi:hypothetical protein
MTKSFIWELICFVEIPPIRWMRHKISSDERISLGISSIVCFFVIVVSTLPDDDLYLPLLFDENDCWANLVWKVGLISILMLLIFSYKKISFSSTGLFSSAIEFSNVLLLYYYNLLAISPMNSFFTYRTILFYLWWLSMSFFLRYLKSISTQNNIQPVALTNIWIFLCVLIKYLRSI